MRTEERMTAVDDSAYLLPGEVARMLHVSSKTVSRWAKEGRLPHVLTLGGHRRFPRAAIEMVARQGDNRG